MDSVATTLNNHVNGWAGGLRDYFGLTDTSAMMALIAVIFLVGAILFFVIRPIMLVVVDRIVARGNSPWLAAADENHVFHRLSWLIPGFFALLTVPVIVSSTLPFAVKIAGIIETTSEVFLVGVITAVISSVLNTAETRFRSFKLARKYSIKSYMQVAKIILFLLATIVIIAIIIGQSPIYLLTGLGAMTAVGMLIFRDSILGFVASIQLSAYDMIRVGDWIEMTKYGADGTVIDISLNTIKIQNFDKTIVTIPSFTILTDGVKNWRGMSQAGCRRIKRHITININSIKLCNPELLNKLCQMPLLKNRLDQYLKEEHRHVDDGALSLLKADKAGLTNLTLYRLYLEEYLTNHPCVTTKMSFLVRELQDSHYGLPIEIYIFLNVTDWAKYESIQSDIFDYVYSITQLFELQIYQYQSETKMGYIKGDT